MNNEFIIAISTNSLAVQGRGYSLATFFLMCSLYCGYQISCLNEKRRHYILFAVSLYLGLYTLMTSVYWVVSVCTCFGILLLLLKKYRQLLWLVMSSVAAAILTVGSYSVLWFSMGAQSIQNELSLSDSLVHIVFDYPRTCLKRGINIMMSDRNVQSIDRSAFVHDSDIVIFSKEVSIGQWPCIITDEDMQSLDIENRKLVYENDWYWVYR